jgi:hypothetical protein
MSGTSEADVSMDRIGKFGPGRFPIQDPTFEVLPRRAVATLPPVPNNCRHPPARSLQTPIPNLERSSIVNFPCPNFIFTFDSEPQN